MRIWLNMLASGIFVLIATYILPGVHVDGLFTAIIVAVLLSLSNSVIGGLLKLLTLPPDFLYLWLVSVVVNVVVVLLVAKFMSGFTVTGYGPAFIFSFILSLVGAGFSLEPKKRALRFK